MAEYYAAPEAGALGHDTEGVPPSGSQAGTLVNFTNIAGAVVSLALIVGVAAWGYRLMVRDVSGIPVVRAASGEMRVRPEEPGGELARHQGLAVNAVAEAGSASAPADELRLAPRPLDVTEEDPVILPGTQPAVVAPAPLDPENAVTAQDVTAALQSGDVDELVAQLTAGVAPMTDPGTGAKTVKAAATRGAAGQPQEGLYHSLRPRKRPAKPAQIAPAAAVVPAPSVDVDPASLPAGTRLAQLGAFDSAAVAREQWDELQGRFGVYLQGKKRVIQKATSGGRTFYRLRAVGFTDIADARRFCSALVAENADCIPVVTR